MELQPLTLADRRALPQAQAAELAGLIARDLAGLIPELAGFDLVALGAHFDPVELLRPGWPVHRALADLQAQAPGPRAAGRVVAFGSHDNRLPEALTPDPNHVGGPLRLLPLAVIAPDGDRGRISERIEAVLLDSGMAGADTALLAQDVFGARIEHARLLSLHDLLALTAMQYEHAGLAALWPLLEAALLAPETEEWLDAPPEPLLRQHRGTVWSAELDFEAWRQSDLATAQPAEAYRHFQRRLRQLRTVVVAHGIPVLAVDCPVGADRRQVLAACRA